MKSRVQLRRGGLKCVFEFLQMTSVTFSLTWDLHGTPACVLKKRDLTSNKKTRPYRVLTWFYLRVSLSIKSQHLPVNLRRAGFYFNNKTSARAGRAASLPRATLKSSVGFYELQTNSEFTKKRRNDSPSYTFKPAPSIVIGRFIGSTLLPTVGIGQSLSLLMNIDEYYLILPYCLICCSSLNTLVLKFCFLTSVL